MKKYELQTFQLVVGLFVVFFVVRAISAGISGTRGPDIPVKQISHDDHGHDDHGHDDHGHSEGH
ncbi:hypothetical protein CL659_00330 [bacterium]|nr:hypothetical protein [bacterium]|tara:strand:+ start:7125 stop:7316 length:192 start_codon:yes stop_codon:yes gene_type:complete